METNRANIVSSFAVIKGSMIDETYSVFAAWNFARSKKENLDRLRTTNFIGAKSDSWLHDVAKVLNRRFDPNGRDRALVTLAKSGFDLEEWKPLLLWHMTQDEFLIKDFLIRWLFPTCYDSNIYRISLDDLDVYLSSIRKRGGTTEHTWTTNTLQRVAGGLLRVAADFGLIKGTRMREFASYHLPERSFIYLLYIIFERYRGNTHKVINALEWRIFLLCPSDIERELLRLHDLKKLKYEADAIFPHLTLPCDSAEEYVDSITEYAPGSRCEVGYAYQKIEWLDPKSAQIQQAQVFVGVLGFSQLIFAWASEDDKGLSWLQAHHKMFDAFGGVPHVTVCDCIKHGVITSHRYDPSIDPGYVEIATHYMTDVLPVRVEYPNDKALVDGAEALIMRIFHFVYRRHTFTSIAEINYALAHIVDRINRKVQSRLKSSRLQRWAAQEKHELKPLPGVAFEAVEWNMTQVHSDSTISFESAYYSVPYQYRNNKVRIKLSATHIEIFVDLDRIALHKRDFARRAARHTIPEHLPDNDTAYHDTIPQGLLSKARLVSKELHTVVDQLFMKDTLGNLRRAQRLVHRAHVEINECGRETAEPRVQEAIEQMRQFNNFRVHYFEATLRQLKQKSRIEFPN